MTSANQAIETKAINAIRTLAIDAVEKANSGHPGMPMGAAPMAYTLWSKFLNHNPANPQWYNRDRFVLSAGHGSAMLYSLLHLFGYDVTLEDLKQFRQWGSKTPGHPEYGHTPGVEATTGPLGQGIAMAVGMAMAERHLAAVYNRRDHEIVDHFTYAICGDGDLMEGVALEAISLAGHLKLGKCIILYDSNDISLDGDLHRSFSENVQQKFEGAGWHYLRVEDGNDPTQVQQALEQAKRELSKPTLIEVKTTIGYGSPTYAGTSEVHGKPLGAEEIKLVREQYEWSHEEFHVPDEVVEHFKQFKQQGEQKEQEWNQRFERYKTQYPELAQQFLQAMNGELPTDWDSAFPSFEVGKKIATREASGQVINALAKKVPMFFGGAADLASSNKTMIKGEANFEAADYSGRNIWFGVREHAMAATMNGIALHGGMRVYGGTFFVFSDYLRPALRMSALQKLPVTYVFTHDSIAVGEDGPTHEPIEHLPSLRAIPDLTVLRPADANETAAAWKIAVTSKDRPVALVLSRQGLPVLEETENVEEQLNKGAYILSDAQGTPDLILIASGSEVSLVLEAKKELERTGVNVRVVSMPSWDLFEQQSQEYKQSVLPSDVKKRLAVEMAHPMGWEKYTGDEGAVLGISTFGASAPGGKIVEEYGFSVEHVVAAAHKLLEQ